ncbi:prenyltransferase [Plantactinospora siamensis]|uniref:Prenyltransferase n=1 Tax=Plantactinospora siamensis TaxID=555372 RepID=A0ABV6P5M8_9ACTN
MPDPDGRTAPHGRAAPDRPAALSGPQLRATAGFIAAQQRPDGGIPSTADGPLDPWDHVESAMALSASGLRAEAERAYAYSARTQRPDGSWPMLVRGDVVEDPAADTNQCAYLAVGVWHHYLVTRDRGFLDAMWPTVRRLTEFVLAAQRPTGELAWAVNRRGQTEDFALLTGSASAVQSVHSASLIAGTVGADPRPWHAAAARLAHAVRHHPGRFADRSRWSMDWYYPVLGGACRGGAARQRLADGWDTFVWPAWGVRCVADRPWVTVAETCELVLALDAVGDPRAHRLFRDVQRLRDPDGGYQMGYVVDDRVAWPDERPTWTAAAVLLAADALSRTSPGAAVFADAGAMARAARTPVAGCGCPPDAEPRYDLAGQGVAP